VKSAWRNALCSIQLLAAVAFAAACERIVDPALPPTATVLVPPPVYEKWWTMTESCSGVTRRMSDVSWFVVPGVTQFQLNGEAVSGYWTEGSNRIVLADSSRLDGSVVRHEMLHALIKGSGHPRSAFLEKCAGLVSCTEQCVADAGAFPTVTFSAPRVPTDSIDVSVQLVPGLPTATVDEGVFALIVTAQNRLSHPVTANLQSLGGGLAAPFSYEVRALVGPGFRIVGALSQSDPSVTLFTAGETKKQYFDLVIGSAIRGRAVTNGSYRVTGWYGNHATVLSPVTIGQQ
jgi:hypothetical protein